MRTAISFIIIFNIIVFVHELGHYLMARKNGIKVHEFALGMGPALFKKEKSGILYALRAFPIGGYVKMEGEDSVSESQDSFSQKTAWQRFQVIVAGAFNNLVLALILFMIFNLVQGVPTTEIGEVLSGSPAEIAGIEEGDKLVEINGNRVRVAPQVNMEISQSEGEIPIVVEREGERVEITVTPEITEEGQKMIGIAYETSSNVWRIFLYSIREMLYFITAILTFLGGLITGQQGMEMVSGPVGIVREVGRAAEFGIMPLIFLTAYISMNLGIVNLLPIPAMDGGRIVFILIELIRGKPVPAEKEGVVHAIGFIALLALIIVVTYFDVVKLFQ